MKIHELNASLTKISEQYSRDIRGVSDSAEAYKSSYQKELDKKWWVFSALESLAKIAEREMYLCISLFPKTIVFLFEHREECS